MSSWSSTSLCFDSLLRGGGADTEIEADAEGGAGSSREALVRWVGGQGGGGGGCEWEYEWECEWGCGRYGEACGKEVSGMELRRTHR